MLDLLRHGLTNEAIAERLSISADTAKFHVSEILGKLGVSTRDEAARWPGRPKRLWLWLPRIWPWPAVLSLALLSLIAAIGGLSRSWSGDGTSQDLARPTAFDEGPQPLQLVVCYNDDTWTRPTVEEQAAHINDDRRYAPFGALHEAQFAADFWAPPLGASPVGTVIEFSGLWTLGSDRELVPALSRTCPVAGSNAGLDAVYLWLFGFGAQSAAWSQEQLTVTVTSKPAGFQIIQVRLPGPITDYGGGPILFTGSGKAAVGRIERGTIWSTRP